MKYLAIRNWQKYQHYKDRRPLWVKLHVSLLDDEDLMGLSVHTRLLAVLMLCLAGNKENQIPNSPKWMMVELEMSESAIRKGIKELLDIRFIEEWTPAKSHRKLAEGWGTRYIKPAVREFVMERDGNQCVECLAEEGLEIDHILPVSQGGSSDASNLQILCRSCNRRKRATLTAAQQRSEAATQEQSELRSLETETEETSNEVSSRLDGHDPIWEVLVELFGPVAPKTQAHGKRNKAVGDLRKHGATAATIHSAARRFISKFPGATPTDMAIATHYPSLIHGTVHSPRPSDNGAGGVSSHVAIDLLKDL